MSGEAIAKLIFDWADNKRMHPDDFDSLFVPELIDMLREDKEESIPEDHIASFVDDCAHLAANSPLEGTRRFYQGAHSGALTAARILGVKLPKGGR